MSKRIFELALEDVLNMNASLLKEIIKKSEGRSVMGNGGSMLRSSAFNRFC